MTEYKDLSFRKELQQFLGQAFLVTGIAKNEFKAGASIQLFTDVLVGRPVLRPFGDYVTITGTKMNLSHTWLKVDSRLEQDDYLVDWLIVSEYERKDGSIGWGFKQPETQREKLDIQFRQLLMKLSLVLQVVDEGNFQHIDFEEVRNYLDKSVYEICGLELQGNEASFRKLAIKSSPIVERYVWCEFIINVFNLCDVMIAKKAGVFKKPRAKKKRKGFAKK